MVISPISPGKNARLRQNHCCFFAQNLHNKTATLATRSPSHLSVQLDHFPKIPLSLQGASVRKIQNPPFMNCPVFFALPPRLPFSPVVSGLIFSQLCHLYCVGAILCSFVALLQHVIDDTVQVFREKLSRQWRMNRLLRHCLERLARKTYCYSKSLQMIKYSLLLFVHRDFIECIKIQRCQV